MKKVLPLFLFSVWAIFYCSNVKAAGITPMHGPGALQFTENKGQWNNHFYFRADLPEGKLLFEKNAFYFFLYSQTDVAKIETHPAPAPTQQVIHGHAFKEEFVNANANPVITGGEAFSNYNNYYLGNDRSRWASGVKNYRKINYGNLYNGIDMVVYSNENQVRYDFVVAPYANPAQIKINYHGADGVAVVNGNLHIKTSLGDVIEQMPLAYQFINGFKQPVRCAFTVSGTQVSFELPDGYNQNEALIIDPNIVFATYTGATGDNWGYTATYDDFGNMYLGGYINDIDIHTGLTTGTYPTTVGAFQTTWGGGTGGQGGTGNGIGYSCDMGITKFKADGTALLFSTYIGGNDNETPHSLVVDPQGNLIVYGVTYSANYPVTAGCYDNSYNGGGDIVVTKLNATGTALIGSTFIGGDTIDGINYNPQEFTLGNLKRNYGDQNRGEVNIDAAGNIYVASCTQSANFPTTAGVIQSAFGGGQDGCAFKLNSNCSQLIWSTYLGGNSDDACYSLDIGPAGTLYVAGGTMSHNFPTSNGSLHTSYLGGTYDGFVACINATGTQFTGSSYIGTSGDDQVYFVKLDANNNVYIVGQTTGQYPVVNATYSNANSGQFIVKLNPTLSSVFYSTVFGNGNGAPNISPTAFLVDTCENIYVAGWGTSNSVFTSYGFTPNVMYNMPLTGDAYQSGTDGTDFYFFCMSKNAQSLLYGSYFGGNGAIEHVDGGTSRFDKRGVIYEAICAGCLGNSLTPTTAGVWSPTNQSGNCNELGLKMAFNLSGTSVQLQAYPRATGCVPLTVQFTGVINNAQSYTWYFGDGASVSNLLTPVHTYLDTGVYDVMLVGLDSNSCNLSDTAHLQVLVRDDSLVADFLPNLQINCDSNKITLQSLAQYSSTHYSWNLGDNGSATTPNVTHYYANAGTYNITLVVSDSTKCNLQDTFTSQVRIPPKITARFALSDSTGCVPLLVNFNANGAPTSTYQWSFGDGATSTLPAVSHTYTSDSSYLVQLVVSDTASCNHTDTAYAHIVTIDSFADANFLFSRTFFGCDSVRITAWSLYQGEDSQLWDFGDGSPASGADTIIHTYTIAGTYTITHYLTDHRQVCKPMDTAEITVSLMPLHISITVPDTGGCLPFTANFTGNSALTSTNYYWFFGDGDSTDGSVVSHTYNQTGTFNVVVLGTDTNACVGADSAFAQITVVNDSAIAAFQMNVLNACDSDLVIDLINNSTNATGYVWDFGDGSATSTQTNEHHQYHQPGTYTVTLTATDSTRCHPVSAIAKPVTLLPNATINFTFQDVCLGTIAQFVNLSNPTAQFTWQFGDQSTSHLYSPSHLYHLANTYNVQLTMIDSSTCDVYDTITKEIFVYDQPYASFTMNGDTVKFETPVDFINTGINYQHLFWDFGDGDTADEERPVHIYEKIGDVTVCLRVYNDVCADTVCKDLYIAFDKLIGVPNAFSPNGDGINDVVRVEGKGIVELTFSIYNRWGEKVFETHDKSVGWDGYYKGALQEMDVYTYAVGATFINGQTTTLKGNITLLR